MKSIIDYKNSPCPKFDAVEDCKQWLGPRWDMVLEAVSPIKDCNQFAFALSFAGIQGFPVIAMYELINGEESWQNPAEND